MEMITITIEEDIEDEEKARRLVSDLEEVIAKHNFSLYNIETEQF